jgi:hypothetical protein
MKEKHTTKSSQTDWDRVINMKDEEIDYSEMPTFAGPAIKNN